MGRLIERCPPSDEAQMTPLPGPAPTRVRTRAGTRALSWGRPAAGPRDAGTLTVFVVAVAARLIQDVRGGGFESNYGYDASVYYAAGDALIHGRMPYRDFVLLHPPGIMLATAPFAAAGRLTTDHIGFILAGLGFTVIGAVNAVLVTVIARTLGTSRTAAFSAGIFAALWIGAVRAEYLTRLEPLANLFVLLGLYAYAACRRRPTGWSLALMGAALAGATSVKVWYVVPLVVMAGWVLLRVPRRRATAAFATGAGAAFLAIDGPFFALAPSQMWHMVVTQQLGRAGSNGSLLTRLDQLVDLGAWQRAVGDPVATVIVTALLLALVGLALAGARRPAGRVLVVLLGVQVFVVAVAPSWYSFYSDYLTPALTVSVALGLDVILHGRWRMTTIRSSRIERPILAAAAGVGLLVLFAPTWWQRAGIPFPRARLAAAVASEPCVMSDSPMALIELDALSRSFAPGCRDWVDITGRTYGADRMNTPRLTNTRWQRDIAAYLQSGTAFIVIRGGTGLSARTQAELRHRPVVARSGYYVIYRGRSVRR